MSLADFTSIIFSALSTVTWVPGRKPIFDGDCEAATGDTVSSVSSVMRAVLDRLERDIGRHQLGQRRGIPGIGGVLGLQHLAGIGLDQQQRFGMRDARRNDSERCDKQRSSSTVTCEATGEENALSDSGPLRPACRRGGPDHVTFGFQACPAPSVTAAANLYRLAGPEQRLVRLNRGRNGPNFGDT